MKASFVFAEYYSKIFWIFFSSNFEDFWNWIYQFAVFIAISRMQCKGCIVEITMQMWMDLGLIVRYQIFNIKTDFIWK